MTKHSQRISVIDNRTYEERLNDLASEPITEKWGTTWYLNDGTRRAHRLDGPAVMWKGGDREYHYYGIDVTKEVLSWAAENNIKLSDDMEPSDGKKLAAYMKETFGGRYHISC